MVELEYRHCGFNCRYIEAVVVILFAHVRKEAEMTPAGYSRLAPD
jgi:hypothetical protein